MLNRSMRILTLLIVFAGAAFSFQAVTQTTSGDRQAAILTVDPMSLPSLKSIPRDQQIELALSAAPSQISGKATIYVLESKGYVKARTGTNGFTCLVEQQYADQTVEPLCYDAEGSATTLLARFYREELRAAGVAEDEVTKRIKAGYRSGKLKAPRKPGFAYMLSTQNKVFDPFTKKIMVGPPHLMFYAPYAMQKDVGEFAGVQYPFVLWEGEPDAFIIVIHTAKAVLPEHTGHSDQSR